MLTDHGNRENEQCQHSAVNVHWMSIGNASKPPCPRSRRLCITRSRSEGVHCSAELASLTFDAAGRHVSPWCHAASQSCRRTCSHTPVNVCTNATSNQWRSSAGLSMICADGVLSHAQLMKEAWVQSPEDRDEANGTQSRQKRAADTMWI